MSSICWQCNGFWKIKQMRKNRNDILKNFLENEDLISLCGISESDLEQITFEKSPSDGPILAALKRLILSYCDDEAQITVIKNVNLAIEEQVES